MDGHARSTDPYRCGSGGFVRFLKPFIKEIFGGGETSYVHLENFRFFGAKSS